MPLSKKLTVLNIIILGLTWILQLVAWQSHQASIRPLSLLVSLTIIYLLSCCLPPHLKSWFNATIPVGLHHDLHVTFLTYNFLLLVIPGAFSNANINGRNTAIGIILTVVSLPFAYLPNHRILGPQMTAPRANENWRRTLRLGAKISWVVGTLSFVLGTLSEFAFLVALSTGFIVLCTGMLGYLTYLNHHRHQ